MREIQNNSLLQLLAWRIIVRKDHAVVIVCVLNVATLHYKITGQPKPAQQSLVQV